jgi:hypothetical protein
MRHRPGVPRHPAVCLREAVRRAWRVRGGECAPNDWRRQRGRWLTIWLFYSEFSALREFWEREPSPEQRLVIDALLP